MSFVKNFYCYRKIAQSKSQVLFEWLNSCIIPKIALSSMCHDLPSLCMSSQVPCIIICNVKSVIDICNCNNRTSDVGVTIGFYQGDCGSWDNVELWMLMYPLGVIIVITVHVLCPFLNNFFLLTLVCLLKVTVKSIFLNLRHVCRVLACTVL